ncbi:DEAD/DEAH box helicase [Mucilaginibacter terrae]|uniref:Superfamily II DNA/RNA helicase n=1 Tax=Mucilaginibacter terrae TaxID=1955052 RepID=A0ABU3H0S4_9SPHI|nr:DEAD/DEAH box helicase [Mucilaginibacter terrae]MDT3405619.1 superfamily II DNA/RNA helicase [Mucilaginibacter terrae]
MAWAEKLKLKKGLVRALTEAGFNGPTEIQQKTLSRIAGGQDIIAIGPNGCGKTTTYIMGALSRFTYAADGVTRVLILVPDREAVEAVIERFNQLNTNKSIRLVGLYPAPGTEAQMDDMAEGADIVVATPDRARAIYLKLGLNLNTVELLVIDDADLIVKQGLQLPVNELAASIQKGQHLVFTEVMHDKLDRMISTFMRQPATIEVEEIGEPAFDTIDQLLYHVPNFGTKLNLLRLFMQDEELFTKTIVFVNTRPTAEKLYKTLQNRNNNIVAIFSPWFFEWTGFSSVEDFMADETVRTLIVVNEDVGELPLQDVPFLLHFELPADVETYVTRVKSDAHKPDAETMALTFVTDLELNGVRKIEQATGHKIQVGDLPEDLVIEKERKKLSEEEKEAKTQTEEPERGAAFHEKKAKNSKNYNYSSGEKAKMTKKKKYG